MKATILLVLISVSAYAQIDVKTTKETRLLHEKSIAFASDMYKIKPGETIKVIDYDYDWYTVTYKDSTGFVYYPFLMEILELNDFKAKKQSQHDGERYAKKMAEFKAKWGKNAEKILNHQLWIGMSKKEAVASIGNPESVNSTTTADGTSDQWVYKNRYLYFDNGVLTTIQDNK